MSAIVFRKDETMNNIINSPDPCSVVAKNLEQRIDRVQILTQLSNEAAGLVCETADRLFGVMPPTIENNSNPEDCSAGQFGQLDICLDVLEKSLRDTLSGVSRLKEV